MRAVVSPKPTEDNVVAGTCRCCGSALEMNNAYPIPNNYPFGGVSIYSDCNSCRTINRIDRAVDGNVYAERQSNDFQYRKWRAFTIAKRAVLRWALSRVWGEARNLLCRHPSSVVDFGCGNGECANIMRAIAGDVNIVAVDVSETPPAELHPTIAYWSATNFLETRDRHDMILLRHVLEHVEAPVELLQKLAMHLRPEGVCILELPNAESMMRRILGRRWGGYYAPFHWFVPTLEGLKCLLKQAGMKIDLLVKVHPPIIGSSLASVRGVPYNVAVGLGGVLYPLQIAVSWAVGAAEALRCYARPGH